MAHLKGTKYSFTALFNADDVSHKSAYAGANDHGFAIVNNMSYNLRPDSMGIATSAGELMTKALGACLIRRRCIFRSLGIWMQTL